MSKLSCGIGIVLAALVASVAHGDPPDTGIHRMVILSGPNRSVHYFSTGTVLSPGETNALLSLERAENLMTYTDSLLALKQQYINSDLLLEPERRYVQKALYGNTVSSSQFDSFGTSFSGGFRNYAYPFLPYNYGGAGGGYGGMGFGGSSALITKSLANGVGDEGRLKAAMVQLIAQEATPEAAVMAQRAYEAALARAASSRSIRTALRLPEPKEGTYRFVGDETPSHPVILTLKDGSRIAGTKLKEDGDWYVVEGKNTVEKVRKAEVTRIQQTSTGIRPIGG